MTNDDFTYLTEKHIIKPNHRFYYEIDHICWLSKNLFNYANFYIRQKYFNKEPNPHQLFDLYQYVKQSNDYIALPRKVSNGTIQNLILCWKSYFSLLKKKKNKQYNKRVEIIKYKPIKEKGRYITRYDCQSFSMKELRKGYILLSGTKIKFKTNQELGLVKEVRLIPKGNYYVIEVIYKKKKENLNLNKQNVISIDLGVNNLMSITSNISGFQPLLIKGTPLKSINQFYNKQISKLKSKLPKNKKCSNLILNNYRRRKNKIEHYLHNASNSLIGLCKKDNVGTIIIGYNNNWKQEINIGKKNNQNFVNIPHSELIHMIKYKSELIGNEVVEVNESHTSKCSFFDYEEIKHQDKYLGIRIKRGLFKTAEGCCVNADINASYNILIRGMNKIGLEFNLVREEMKKMPLLLEIKGFHKKKSKEDILSELDIAYAV